MTITADNIKLKEKFISCLIPNMLVSSTEQFNEAIEGCKVNLQALYEFILNQSTERPYGEKIVACIVCCAKPGNAHLYYSDVPLWEVIDFKNIQYFQYNSLIQALYAYDKKSFISYITEQFKCAMGDTAVDLTVNDGGDFTTFYFSTPEMLVLNEVKTTDANIINTIETTILENPIESIIFINIVIALITILLSCTSGIMEMMKLYVLIWSALTVTACMCMALHNIVINKDEY